MPKSSTGQGPSPQARRRRHRCAREARATLAHDMLYWPNPAHKAETTEAGPPLWTPDKDLCPTGMTVAERRDLLATSVPANEEDPRSRRFALRRTEHGLELFDVKWTEDSPGGDPVFHGHPASRVPRTVLKRWRDDGVVTAAEYRRLSRELPGC